MGFSDIASRIGSIQGTLAMVNGTETPSAALPRTVTATQNPATGLSAETLAGTLQASAVPGAAANEEFTRVLEQALESGLSPVPETKTTAVDAVDKPPKAQDGKTDGTDVVREARKYLGVPYVWGGNNPKIGLDCSSFVQHTFRDLGIELPRVARDQAKQGTEVPSLAQAKPGDLIVTRGGGHIGIYLGDNKMIHAPRPGESVSIRKLFETDAQIMTIRRIVPAGSSEEAASSAVGRSQVGEAVAKAAELTAAAQRSAFTTAVSGA